LTLWRPFQVEFLPVVAIIGVLLQRYEVPYFTARQVPAHTIVIPIELIVTIGFRLNANLLIAIIRGIVVPKMAIGGVSVRAVVHAKYAGRRVFAKQTVPAVAFRGEVPFEPCAVFPQVRNDGRAILTAGTLPAFAADIFTSARVGPDEVVVVYRRGESPKLVVQIGA